MNQTDIDKITSYVESIGGKADGQLDEGIYLGVYIHMDNIDDLYKFIHKNYGEGIIIDEHDEEPASGFNYPITLYYADGYIPTNE